MKHDIDWRGVYRLGAVCTLAVVALAVLDIAIGTSLGGSLETIPRTAIDRFAEFGTNRWLGLYHLDLLNAVSQIVFIPGYVALYAAHRRSGSGLSLVALVVFLVGTAIFVCTNTALPMMELADKYRAAGSPAEKAALAGAGEALLARGAHGTPGVFIGFVLPNIAGLLMSGVMLRGGVFGKPAGYLGLFGSLLILAYLVAVTFVPAARTAAMALAAPGGLALMGWMVLFSIKLLRLPRSA